MNEEELKQIEKESKEREKQLRTLIAYAALAMLIMAGFAGFAIYKVKSADELHEAASQACGVNENNYNEFEKRCCYDSFVDTNDVGYEFNGLCYYANGNVNDKFKPNEAILK